MPPLPRRVENPTYSQRPKDPYDPSVVGAQTATVTLKSKQGPEVVTGYAVGDLIFWDANHDGLFHWRDGDAVTTKKFERVRAGSARLRNTLEKLGLKRASQLKDLWWTSAVYQAKTARKLALAATRQNLAALKNNGCQDLGPAPSEADYACLRQELTTLKEAVGTFSADLPKATVAKAEERISDIRERLQGKAMLDAMESGHYAEFEVELGKLQVLLGQRGFELPPILVAAMKDRARMHACLRDAAFSLSEGHLEWAVSDLKRAQHHAENIGLELNLRQQVIAIMKEELIILNGEQLRTLFELLK